MSLTSKAIAVLEAIGRKKLALPSGEEIKIAKTPEKKPYLAIKQDNRWVPYVDISFNEFLRVCDRIPEEALKTPVKVFDEEFEAEFWPLAYRKDAVGNARKAYRTARKKIDKETLLRIWEQANQQWRQRGERQYVPMPATWLNQERWLNEEFAQQEALLDQGNQTKDVQAAIAKELLRIGYTAKLPPSFTRPGVSTYFDLISRSVETAKQYLDWLKGQPVGAIW